MAFQSRNGTIFNDTNQITDEITKELKERYVHIPEVNSSPEVLNLLHKEITSDDNNQLCQSITSLEIKAAVFYMCNDKSPGPDGFLADVVLN